MHAGAASPLKVELGSKLNRARVTRAVVLAEELAESGRTTHNWIVCGAQVVGDDGIAIRICCRRAEDVAAGRARASRDLSTSVDA